jgi:nucleotidyltransferase-like protein
MLFGSTVDGLADERSDIDMAIVFDALPVESELVAACERAGGRPWTWRNGELAADGLAVGFDVDGIEVQIAYTDPRILQGHLDKLLVTHELDTPYHKVGEGLLKAQALIGPERLERWRAQVAAFPAALGDAMMRHHVGQVTPWKWFGLLQRRDAALWCRELLVDACYRQFGMLAGLNRCYFTTFQFKRMHRFAQALPLAPPRLADRVEALLVAPLEQAFAELYALEGEVLALLAAHAPQVDRGAALDRRTRFDAASR